LTCAVEATAAATTTIATTTIATTTEVSYCTCKVKVKMCVI